MRVKVYKLINKSQNRGQMILEFIFVMTVLMIMIYGLIRIFRWTGIDLIQRRLAHENTLTATVHDSYGICLAWDLSDPFNPVCTSQTTVGDGPMKQIDTYFYYPVKMDAIWDGN